MRKVTEYNQLAPTVNHSVLLKVNRWWNIIQSWWMPPRCLLCGDEGDNGRDLCRHCAAELPGIESACLCCGAALPVSSICGACQRHTPAFSETLACFHYRSPVDAMIKKLKFHGDLQAARVLGELMVERLVALPSIRPDLIVPVPLHGKRLRQRGFNQAVELARPIARRLALPLVWRGISRVRATDPQSELPAKLRSRNIKGAFSVTADVRGRRIAIVDDVMTTGHTVNELARTLRRAGAKEIHVWVCARAVFGR